MVMIFRNKTKGMIYKNTGKLDLVKIESFCPMKDTDRRLRQATE
jgi:hypothetical protein